MDNPGRLPGRGGLCFWVSVSPGLVRVTPGRRVLVSGGTRRHGVCDAFPVLLLPRRKGSVHSRPRLECPRGNAGLKLKQGFCFPYIESEARGGCAANLLSKYVFKMGT